MRVQSRPAAGPHVGRQLAERDAPAATPRVRSVVVIPAPPADAGGGDQLDEPMEEESAERVVGPDGYEEVRQPDRSQAKTPRLR